MRLLFAPEGVTGVVLVNSGVNPAPHVVAHLYYVLSMEAVFPIFGAFIYYWLDKIVRVRYFEI